jgi:hypothetical protein
LAFEIGQYAAKVPVQFVAQRFVAEKRPPVFGGEIRVHEKFGERLRLGEMMRETRSEDSITSSGTWLRREWTKQPRRGWGLFRRMTLGQFPALRAIPG